MLVVETVANMSKLKSKCDGELVREFSEIWREVCVGL